MTISEHPRVLLLGRIASREMRPVRDAVFGLFNDAEIRVSLDATCNDDWSPHLVVVCQSQPDEFNQADVQKLLRRYPLARFVCAAGLWCESDGRNRDAWPIGVRIPARICEQRLRRERAVFNGATSPLPLTAGREEAFEFDATAERDAAAKPAIARLISPDRALRERFETDLRDGGYDVTPDRDATSNVLLWDADPWTTDRLEELRRLRREHPESTIVALANFAPPEDERRLIQSGADAVCGKLIAGSALCRLIDNAKTQARSAGLSDARD